MGRTMGLVSSIPIGVTLALFLFDATAAHSSLFGIIYERFRALLLDVATGILLRKGRGDEVIRVSRGYVSAGYREMNDRRKRPSMEMRMKSAENNSLCKSSIFRNIGYGLNIGGWSIRSYWVFHSIGIGVKVRVRIKWSCGKQIMACICLANVLGCKTS